MCVLYRPQHTAIIQNKTRYTYLNIALKVNESNIHNFLSLQKIISIHYDTYLFNPIIVPYYDESLLYSHKNNFLFPFLNKHPRYTELKTLNTQHG